MEPNLHENHRQRVWEKFRRFGLQVFADHEVLELLLFFAIRRGDTNPTAHALLKRFGSLHAVLEAPPEELQKVKGVGPHTASLIKVAFALVGRYQADVAKMEANGDKLNSSERIGAFSCRSLRARGGGADRRLCRRCGQRDQMRGDRPRRPYAGDAWTPTRSAATRC